MVIQDRQNSLELILQEMGPLGTPAEGDLSLRIAVTAPPFTGRVEQVWFTRAEWGGFLEDLQDLLRDRRGEAYVIAMSPHECEFAVFARDSAGHIVAEGWIGHEAVGCNGGLRCRVSFSMEIDPGDLARVVDEFEGLAAAG